MNSVHGIATLATIASLLAGCGGGTDAVTPQSPPPPPTVSAAEAVRLLEQSTFGPTPTLVTHVQNVGLARFVDEQLGVGPSSLGRYTFVDADSMKFCARSANPDICYRDNYTAFPVQRQFFRNAVESPDQLRQRVAFALSQIFVVSDQKVDAGTYGIASYQQMLLDEAFGNVRQLLEDVTLHPAMGVYLDMVDNDGSDPALAPNENYARELLQLLSIGVNKLNADGSVAKDARGIPVPTYDQDVIEGFAHVLTGWSYPTRAGATPGFGNPVNLVGRMESFDNHHDTGSKLLLDGVRLPAGQSAERDLHDALDVVFRHPNVGPFLGKQLIQHLVTSNPSPAYVARITQVFNDNGRGVRGDLKAVVRAILLDPEARGDARPEAQFGKLREPALLLANLVRVFNGRTDGVALAQLSADLGEPVYQAPTVFNFYPPGYRLPGTDLLSPPSKLQNSTTLLERTNIVDTLLSSGYAADSSVSGSSGTALDLGSLDVQAADAGSLVDRLALLLMHNSLSADSRRIVLQATATVPATDAQSRVLMASFLITSSSAYQIQR